MRKLIIALNLLFIFVSCEKDTIVDNDSTIIEDTISILEISQITDTIIGADGGLFTIKLSSSDSWSAESDANWVTLSSNSGSKGKDQLITINIDAHESTNQRNNIITFKNEGHECGFMITQLQNDEIIAIDKKFYVEGHAQKLAINVSSNIDFDVVIPDDVDWITNTVSRGLEDTLIYLNITENGDKERVAKVVLIDKNKKTSETIEINQLIIHTLVLNEGETLESKITNPLGIGTLTISGAGLSEANFHYMRDNMLMLIQLDISGTNTLTIPNSAFSSRGIGWALEYLASVKLPKSITEIGYYAFYNCSSLSKINLPNKLKEISGYAFYNCYSLVSIDLSDSIKVIGSEAFSGCSLLVDIHIPKSLTSIRTRTFSGCKSLTSITIPKSVKQIDSYAFYNCYLASTINIMGDVTYIGNRAFDFSYYGEMAVRYIFIHSKTPPKLGYCSFKLYNSGNIYIPAESEREYRIKWSDYADRMKTL